MKRRQLTDPRVREVLAAFDSQRDSPTRDSSMLCSFMHIVAETVVERFEVPGGWSDDAIRAVLVAFLVNAPDAQLLDMVEAARKETSWLADFEATQAAELARMEVN